MLNEEIISELIKEYGGDREDILLIEDRLNILGIHQDEKFLDLLEEIYSYYMSSEFIAMQSSRGISGIIDDEVYDKIKISIDEAIINVFRNKFSEDYKDFNDIVNNMPLKK